MFKTQGKKSNIIQKSKAINHFRRQKCRMFSSFLLVLVQVAKYFIFPNRLPHQKGRSMAESCTGGQAFATLFLYSSGCIRTQKIYSFLCAFLWYPPYCAQTNAGLDMAQFLLCFLPVQHWLQCAYFRFSLKELKLQADCSLSSTQSYSSAEFTQFLLALIQSWPQVSNEAPIYGNQGT